MNRRNSDELIHDFVRETRDELPERVYAAVRHEIDQSPQRIVLGPWRTPFMNNMSRYALPAFVVALLAVLAVASLNVFGFKSSPTPVGSSPAPSSAPTATPVALDVTNRGQHLPAGTYSVTIPSRATFTFTVPEGWTFDDIGSGRIALLRTSATQPDQWTGYLLIDSVEAVYADPCAITTAASPVDQSVDAITAALTRQANFTASAPSATHLLGASGQTFTVDMRPEAGTSSGACTGVDIALWRDASDFDAVSGSSHQRLWVLDLGRGNPIVVEVMGYPWTSGAEQQAAEEIVNSMTFE